MYIFKFDLFWFTIAPTYYWLMYVLAFIASYILVKRWLKLNSKKMDDLLLYTFLWVILWWRIWYILFYDFAYYLSNPLDLIKTWEWWMSFHGWVIWIILAMYFFSRKHKKSILHNNLELNTTTWKAFLRLADEVCRTLPIWLWLWRLWNYINKELLWFSPYDWPLAVYINSVWYFPSPLLEAFLEWVVLFLILNYFYNRKKEWKWLFSRFLHKNNLQIVDWQIWALFLIFYSIFRIFVEIFFRMPDSQIWYILGFLTMWEILSLPMLFVWVYYYIKLSK